MIDWNDCLPTKEMQADFERFKELKTTEEQEAIAGILFDMDLDIYKLEEKLSKYQKIKLGMMDELLTGKVRLV